MLVSHDLVWSKYVGSDTTAGNMATTGGATVAVLGIAKADDVGLQLVWSGSSPAGAFTFGVSNCYDPATNTAGTWTTLPTSLLSGTGTLNPAGSDSDNFVTWSPAEVARAKWMKITYTPASGSGTLRGYAHLKGAE